jgi:hypothetical protein
LKIRSLAELRGGFGIFLLDRMVALGEDISIELRIKGGFSYGREME